MNEDGIKKIPDFTLEQLIEKIDHFEKEIEKFKVVVDHESEIIPELTIQLHELLDLLSRFQIMTEQLRNNKFDTNLQQNKLVFKRAFVYSIRDLLDDYFSDLIDDLSKRAEVSEDFKENLVKFNSEEVIEKSLNLQEKLFERMLDSLSRQLGRKVTFEELF